MIYKKVAYFLKKKLKKENWLKLAKISSKNIILLPKIKLEKLKVTN